ncbi:hypothetical protein DVH24_010137 [Malus domestica]|uniref:Alpha-1,3-mannosyl-glycoprotein 2-beta-N-acetylglucosaminyltransferase n=1 Tax=Malus domestica TaxID=3750 RepID=A0A498JWE5_MALDO|nr:hypothetical protein DVH24_010137 [Malus domestica]
MKKILCDFRFLLFLAAAAFIYIQIRLFTTQSKYADRLADAIESENQCTSQLRTLIDQISLQQGQIVSLEGTAAIVEEKQRLEQECGQLKVLVQELERKGLGRLIDKNQVPVAAVVIMACNRADYLERTVKSVLKYQSSVASKFPLFVSQDGSHPAVKQKALSYDQLTYMQHLDYEPVHAERPGELIAYYKIARHYKWALDGLFYKHNFNRVIILEGLSWPFPRGMTMGKSSLCMILDCENCHASILMTCNFMQGSSLGQFFKQYLEPIKLNDVPVDWKSMDLSYLMEDKYIKHFADIVQKAKPIRGSDLVLKARNIGGDVRVQYTDQPDFEYIARQFGIFEEWKDGVPRTAYKGIVVFRYHIPQRIFLVGPDSLKQLGVNDS